MAWSASVIDVDKASGFINVTVEYTDGTESFSEVYRSSRPAPNWIQHTVFYRIEELNIRDSTTINTGDVTPIDPTPDIDETLFKHRVEILLLVQVMIEMGIVPANHAKVVALKSWIQNNAVEYFDSL